ncbi:hypothetical protein B0T19DRAFT_414874 [Cercophora scortea]|uniref:Uncharacterized protein n=1 Tax=Cercophora scortea TaxID=314031 RepID=A0AAE0IWB3_9PEZI|nr:hypothetical protein B0T19DRAFT_414874 [Cercophora scortea]
MGSSQAAVGWWGGSSTWTAVPLPHINLLPQLQPTEPEDKGTSSPFNPSSDPGHQHLGRRSRKPSARRQLNFDNLMTVTGQPGPLPVLPRRFPRKTHRCKATDWTSPPGSARARPRDGLLLEHGEKNHEKDGRGWSLGVKANRGYSTRRLFPFCLFPQYMHVLNINPRKIHADSRNGLAWYTCLPAMD